MNKKSDHDKALVVFEGKHIRRTWHDNEWYFSVVDVIAALTDSVDAKDYWYRLKKRELESSEIELSTFCRQLKLVSSDGKKYFTDCANTKSIFRIIQSIPSKKAEPFKLWLAKVGYERVQEIQDPELAQKRMKELYRAKGYSDEWIEKRVRGIAVRQELTDEWRTRKVDENVEFAILTNEISKATFGKTVEEYKEFKGLKKQNLRDHMGDLELIFNMLGEASTTEIARAKDTQGFAENKTAAKEGGDVAGNARKELEKKSGKPIVSDDNYLSEPEKVKRKRLR
ncbi:MAG: phage antirepressor protein [Nanoarchaeota archaeon]|nr:phage antirepressor protein [Nanoarchaeota archaeon]MBU1321670.1 phage antirepressor protein [Nanoarchaeota archaeon]MBU1598418.1 phage antirepressor protein [Nanoarchaeota archaeon]MBU2441044.1 phage antirepressor protein [Nanoarchaeota archaeon]